MPGRLRVLALLSCLSLYSFKDLSAGSVYVSPTSASLSPGQGQWFSAAVPGTSSSNIAWSISPPLGSVSNNGYYQAPSGITTPQTVVLTATSVSNLGHAGSAVISLMPGGGIVAVASGGAPLSLVPASVSLSAGQSAVFTAFSNGANVNASVSWTISPAFGAISGGVYQAPASLAASQTVTVTAISLSNAAQTASASVMLTAAGSPAPTSNGGSVFILPSSASLTAGQGIWFSGGVSGPHNSGISWSLSPPVGTITNGYYLAPSTILNSQVVMLTATSLADPNKSASVPISLISNSGGGAAVPQSQPTTVTAQLTPSSVSLVPGQSAQFSFSLSNGTIPPASWSLVPNIGTLTNGLYTAPASVATQTSVTVIATSTTDSTKTASAAITLHPNTVQAVSISVSPGSVSLTSGQVAQFGATIGGTSNTASTWSLSPAVGSIVSGTYTAPVSITTQQAITISATSVADPTKSASATVTLVPVTIGLAPATISLAGGKSAQFTATVTGAANTGVTWSIAPPVGSVTNGLYLAPSTVSTAQNVTLTATSVADPTKTAQAVISLAASVIPSSFTVSPALASLSASQSQQFSAVASSGISGSGGVSVQWSLNPAVGSITQTGVYTAPSSIPIQQTISVIATSSSTAISASVTLTPSASSPTPPSQPAAQATTVLLPLEIMGASGTTVPVTINVPSGSSLSGQSQLWLQIHGLKYESEASVQVNGGSWIPINTSTVTFQDNAGQWGGIGGGFATMKVTLNLPAGSIVAGNNTLAFRFNGTDGVTSGFRVLNLNILSNGSQLIPQSSFTWDDPTTWQPPLNTATDIQAGQTLWRTGSLVNSSGTPLVAHCSDCHSQDGRDLKYFNYSNYSIRVRSMFHGLTQQQGDQIASYIRSLNTPAPANARPWNPPYQPGPGLDSQPVTNWAAGAGLSAVLAEDSQEIAYVYPSGANPPNLNPRETPIFLQLPDWNRWLPQIAPQDSGAFSTTCNGSIGPFGTAQNMLADYQSIRSTLGTVPATPQAYGNAALSIYGRLITDLGCTQGTMEQTSNWSSATYVMQVRSVGLWLMTKLWEINQEFGLEGMPGVGFPATTYPKTTSAPTEPRAWLSTVPFFLSPFMEKIPDPSPGIGNGTHVAHVYESFIWYHLQLILNDGNGYGAGTTPIDWGYALAYVSSNLPWDQVTNTFRTGTAGLLSQWWAMNQEQQPGRDLLNWVEYPAVVSQVSPSQLQQVLTNELQELWGILGPQTPAQYCNGPCPAFNSNPATSSAGAWWFDLPMLKTYGVSVSTLTPFANWLATIWPSQNWIADLNETCTSSIPPFGQYVCQ